MVGTDDSTCNVLKIMLQMEGHKMASTDNYVYEKVKTQRANELPVRII